MDPINSIEVIRLIHPGRAALKPREVAVLLYGRDDLSAVQSVTKLLNEGTFIPNLSKLKGRWVIPVAALGAALDNLRAAHNRPVRMVGMGMPTMCSPTGRRRRGTNIGPRPGIIG